MEIAYISQSNELTIEGVQFTSAKRAAWHKFDMVFAIALAYLGGGGGGGGILRVEIICNCLFCG